MPGTYKDVEAVYCSEDKSHPANKICHCAHVPYEGVDVKYQGLRDSLYMQRVETAVERLIEGARRIGSTKKKKRHSDPNWLAKALSSVARGDPLQVARGDPSQVNNSNVAEGGLSHRKNELQTVAQGPAGINGISLTLNTEDRTNI